MAKRDAKARAMEKQSASEQGPPPGAASPRTSGVRWAWEWTKSILMAFVLFLVVRAFVVEAFQIPTASMESTLLVGDFLLVNKMVYGAEIPGTRARLPAFDAPERGDIVVFEPPSSAGQPERTNYVKRIVGAPGDTLAMRDGVLYRNGEQAAEPYAMHSRQFEDPYSPQFRWQRTYLVRDGSHKGEYRPTRDNWGPIAVPESRYFVMGDNRDNSEDSRYWGFVPLDAIKGKPLIIYYSYDREELVAFPWLTEIRWDRLLNLIR